MRLINTETLEMEEFFDGSIPHFAILSHTWSVGEVSFQDMRYKATARLKRGYAKIYNTCKQARAQGLAYAWVDTCCIDKSSSAELQEAINSMYRWYAAADICFAFLSDVDNHGSSFLRDETRTETINYQGIDCHLWRNAFAASVWFTRGWTLQELIAPKELYFFGRDWVYMGKRQELTHTISAATGINVSVLNSARPPSRISVAERMSWAAKRQTSRVEDRAYSLLGIFGVNMPMLYGEGERAFTRLQEEIIRTCSDQSIFAWSSRSCTRGTLLAESPADFADNSNIVPWGQPGPFEMTNQGLRITAPVLDCEDGDHSEILIVLHCRYQDNFGVCLALRCGSDRYENFHVCDDDPSLTYPSRSGRLALVDVDILGQSNPTMWPIQIARMHEVRRVVPMFWLRFSCEESLVNIVGVHPAERWNAERRTFRGFVGGHFQGHLLLKLPSGAEVALAFESQKTISSECGLDSHDGFCAGVSARKNTGRFDIYGQYETLWAGHTPAEEWPSVAESWNAETAELVVANILQQFVMEETVFVIDIDIVVDGHQRMGALRASCGHSLRVGLCKTCMKREKDF